MTTQSKHTPGPWAISKINQRIDIISADTLSAKKLSKESNSGFIIAECFGDDDKEANARLIAAAPELLEALQRLVTEASVSVYKYRPDADNVHKAVCLAKTAIAKAEGK